MKICPHCGKKLYDEAEFCIYCMTPLLEKKDLTPKSKRLILKIIVIITIVAIITALSTALAFTIYYYRREPAPVPPETSDDSYASSDDSTDAVTIFITDDITSPNTTTDEVSVTDTKPEETTVSESVTVSAPETTATPETTTAPDATTSPETTIASETTTKPETTKVPDTTKTPETTKIPETTAIFETTITQETTEPEETTVTVSEYVPTPYRILSIQEMRDFMEYKRNKYCPPPNDTLWCTTPLYDSYGWRGYGYEYRKLQQKLDENENVISWYDWVPSDELLVYINDSENRSVFVDGIKMDTDKYKSDYYKNTGLNTIAHVQAEIVDAVGLIEYINEYPPATEQFTTARLYAHEHGLWENERKIPGFERYERPEGWRGLLQELGINDQNDLQTEGIRENLQYYYWVIILPEGERDIRLTFEYREFTTENGTYTHLEAVMLVEYAE